MRHENRRIIHQIVRPFDDYDKCYMIIMFIESNEVVQVFSVELKKNFMPFEDSAATYYACSSN